MPPAAIFLSTAKEIWKRTPPKTDGFWISLSSNCNCGAKRFRTESPAPLSPLPLPRSTRWCAQIAPAVFKLASLSLPRTTLMVPCAIIVPASAHHRIPAHFRLSLVGAGVPDGPFSVLRLRVAPVSCMYASGGHISFNSERNMEKNAAKNRRFLDFLPSDCDCGAKRSAVNRLYSPPPLPLPRPVRWCAAPLLCSGGCRPVPEGTEHSLSAAGRNGAAGGSDPSAAGRTA